MMIPEKIYITRSLDNSMAANGDKRVILASEWMRRKYLADDIEYVRAPIAKRFDVEKPTEDGWYLIASEMNGKIYHWRQAKWVSTYIERLPHFESFGDPTYWCEIILPTIPEGV